MLDALSTVPATVLDFFPSESFYRFFPARKKNKKRGAYFYIYLMCCFPGEEL